MMKRATVGLFALAALTACGPGDGPDVPTFPTTTQTFSLPTTTAAATTTPAATTTAAPTPTPPPPVVDKVIPLAPKPAAAVPKPAPKPAPVKTAAKGGGASYYPNCDAARAAGAAPLSRGDAGYSSKLDRDGDGVACEPTR